MIDRIQEFSNLAKASVPAGIDVNDWIAAYNKEFAELIEKEVEAKYFSAGYQAGTSDGTTMTVREVLGIVNEHIKEDSSEERDIYLKALRQDLREHFGVE